MEEFQDAKNRLKNRDYLNKLIEEVTVSKTSNEWVEMLEKVGVPCGPINSIDKVFDDPQVKHLGIYFIFICGWFDQHVICLSKLCAIPAQNRHTNGKLAFIPCMFIVTAI